MLLPMLVAVSAVAASGAAGAATPQRYAAVSGDARKGVDVVGLCMVASEVSALRMAGDPAEKAFRQTAEDMRAMLTRAIVAEDVEVVRSRAMTVVQPMPADQLVGLQRECLAVLQRMARQ